MIDIKASEALFRRIYANAGLSERLVSYTARHKTALRICMALGEKKRWGLVCKASPFFKLSLVFAYLPLAKKQYEEQGIDEQIFFDTMNDIKIWIDDHLEQSGDYGLQEFNWIHHHLNLDIFRLGRLQFQKGSYYLAHPYKKDGVVLNRGDKLLNLHIPRGGKLTPEACANSLRLAKPFFAAHFPEYPTACFACYSWMLYPGNQNFMKTSGNILQFAALFDVIKQSDRPEQTYLWLFGRSQNKRERKGKDSGYPDDLPCKTQLQRDALDYLKRGGSFGEGLGIMIWRETGPCPDPDGPGQTVSV